jgi:transposase
VNSPASAAGIKGRVLSSRQAAWLLIHAPDELEDYEQDWLTRLKAACESVGQVHELAQRFRKLVKQRIATDLNGWIQVAKNSGLTDLRNFAMGLQRDYEVVSNALKLPWSNERIPYCTS